MFKTKKEQQRTLRKILNKTVNNQWPKQDQYYAQNQLKKIYSQQFSKLLNEKKYEVIVENNKSQLDEQYNDTTINRAASISQMQERSSERRDKLLKDRIKIYQNNDKKWAYKTEQIKRKVRTKQKEMLKNAEQYRSKWEKQINQRQIEQKIKLKRMSERHHSQFQSNASTSRQSLNQSSFNKARLEQLTRRREKNFIFLRKSKSIDGEIEQHKERQHLLTEQRQKSNYKKLVTKLQKIENIDLKRQSRIKTQSIQRAKSKLYQKVYKNNREEIGPPCSKFNTKQQNFRIKTINNARSHSIIDSRSRGHSLWQSNIQATPLPHQNTQKKNELEWLQYCRKTRRMKLNRLLKKNVRNVLQNQYKKDHFRTHILS